MPLVKASEILADAKAHKYAVASFNVLNVESARGIVAAAEKLNQPVILAHAQLHEKYAPLDYIAPVLVNAAKMAKVPVAAMLDHGVDYDYIVRSLRQSLHS